MKKLYAALMTAFDENGNIDEQGTREMVRSEQLKRSACLRSQWMKLRAQISI